MQAKKIKAIIVDDVPKAILVLRRMIEEYCPQIEILASAEDIPHAFKQIQEHRPDLVFLDIELARGTSFDLLELFPQIHFSILFVTAHRQYALPALKLNAIDYLLKPISIKDLVMAVDKVSKWQNLKAVATEYNRFLHIQQSTNRPVKLAISTLEGLHFIDFNQIVRMEADGKYTKIVVKGQKAVLASKNIKAFEAQVPTDQFFRIHRSHLINLAYVQQYLRGEGGAVIMEDGTQLNVAKGRKEAFIRRFEG
ncbi:MAG: LytTR family DNA-binding domain-containing protein [Bacteroidota bacterium]